MNIHLPAILMFTRGTRFWHTATSSYIHILERPEGQTCFPPYHHHSGSVGRLVQDPLALPYALAIERFCSRGSGADLYHLKSEESRPRGPVENAFWFIWVIGYWWLLMVIDGYWWLLGIMNPYESET